MKFLQLNFLPRSVDLALLVLRVWYGASMIAIAGWMKLTNFSAFSSKFVDPFGLGMKTSLALVVFAEVVCAGFLVIGLFTRVSAFILAFTMAVAFQVGHGGKLTGEGNGQSAFLYLGVFVALFICGGGKFSLDAKLGAKT